ncbi:Endopolyphosphatase [Mortierella sp. GBA35]|nr:Endopolyphosphatase [Mortierella sp. GBA35]
MTDLHPDEHYLAGAAVSTSCHTILEDSDENDVIGVGRFHPLRAKHLDDPPSAPDNTTVGGRYGASATICDSPMSLISATFDWVDKNVADSIDFVVWTGDNVRHDSDNTFPRTQEQINAMNKVVATKFLKTFPSGPDGQRLPVIPSIGNNDVYPHNILLPGPNPILQYFATIWSEFIPESMTKTFVRGGYYAAEAVPGKIAVFSLNTMYFYLSNTAVDGCKDEEQPGTEQMDWLENQLEKLRRRKMVAYLTGHVPPAKKLYSPTCYSRYTKITFAFQDVIVGHLYGHLNIDHFFLLSRNSKSGVEEPEPVEDEDEIEKEAQYGVYDTVQSMGYGTYVEDLWNQYDNVPKGAQLKDYAIVLVSPSVVPTLNPTLRVLSYQIDNNNSDDTSSLWSFDGEATTEAMMEDLDETDQRELEEYFAEYLNKGMSASEWDEYSRSDLQTRKPHSSRRHRPDPAPASKFGFPQSFTQYWCNLTQANLTPDAPLTYEIEYRTDKDYELENLGVSEWLALARRITRESGLKQVYLDRMVVQTDVDTTAE